ncbi:MAG TPA: recombinase A [bacterium]|nr:recombinase A [bacterium]
MAASSVLQQLTLRHPRLRLPHEQASAVLPARWSFATLAGRLVEVSAGGNSAALSVAMRLLAEAQRVGDLATWVSPPDSHFYPPDAATHAVDLTQLAVVHVPEPAQVPRAGARLAHSGAFGLVVLDLAGVTQVPDALLGRLVQQAKRHETLVLCLTRKAAAAPSLGSLVAVRAAALQERSGADRYRCMVTVLKDKRHGAGWRHEEVLHGVPGLP